MADCELEMPGLKEYLKELREKAYENRIPLKGIFELTPRCNFNCNMCYVHLTQDEMASYGKRELSGRDWIALAEAAREAGMLELTLTGGELFLHPDFKEIYEAVSGMGFLIQIFSNGSLWDEKMVEWFQKFPPYAVRFTLYGASDQTYEKVCGVKGGFTRVRHAMDLLLKAGMPFYLTATITKENENDLDQMAELAYRYGIPFMHTSSLMNPVRGAVSRPKEHRAELRIPPEDVRKMLRENVKRYPREQKACLAETCGNYRKAFWITWEGKMQLCTFLSEPAVEVKPENFKPAWEELLMKVKWLKQPDKCGACGFKAFCDRCPGTLYTEMQSGVLSDTLCERARLQYEIYKNV